MKKLIALLLISPMAFAEELDFNLYCKVTAQEIIETKDGVVKKYASYVDRVQIGETFPIKFQYKTLKPSESSSTFEFSITDPSRAMNGIFFVAWSYNLQKASVCNPEYLNCDLSYYKDDDYLKRTFKSKEKVEWNISPNEINGINTSTLHSIYSGSVFGLKRYYKNDWELKFSSSGEDRGIHYLTANCMGMPSQFDQLLQALREQYDKKF